MPVAAWILFIAKRQAAGETITDPMAERLLSLAEKHSGDTKALTDAVLNERDVFAELSDNQAFRDTVHGQVEKLSNITPETMAACLGEL